MKDKSRKVKRSLRGETVESHPEPGGCRARDDLPLSRIAANGHQVIDRARQTEGGGSWNAPVDSSTREFVYVPIPEAYPIRRGLAKSYSLTAAAVQKLGISLPAVDDHGELFALAVTVFICCIGVLVLHRHELPIIGRSFSTT